MKEPGKENTGGIYPDKEDINKPSVKKNEEDIDEEGNIDEIESDGSGNAFEKTERVEEDNFDRLSEK